MILIVLLLECRLEKDPSLHESYSNFMNDYLDQGHMVKDMVDIKNQGSSYFIPHHCVIKNDDNSKITCCV